MSEQTAESKSGCWSPPEWHLKIEYPLELLDEIRLAISSSFHANPRGGAEVGGVFFGTYTEETVRIVAWRPMSREHSYEPSFVLSEKDLADLGHLLDSTTTDQLLNGLHPVGWFVPHPRRSLELTENDLQVFNQFFPATWQFTLALQPVLVGATKAAFFVRNADGTLCEHKPEHEFTLEPLRAARVHGRRNPAPLEPAPSPRGVRDAGGLDSGAKLVRVRPGGSTDWRHEATPVLPIDAQPTRWNKRRWLGWLSVIPVMGLLIYAAMVARERFFTESRPATLSLKLRDWPGAQLHVDWEKAAQPLEGARRGELVFNEAGKTRTIELDAAQLHLGSFAYARRSGNVKVKLSVYGENSSGPVIEEVAEFNGTPPPDDRPPAPLNEKPAWEKEKKDLQAEIKRLRGQLRTETAKRQELQNLVRVLENRLRLEPRR